MFVRPMAVLSWPYFDPEYETLSSRINPPRVIIDNDSNEDATLVKVNSANTHGILLEVVQVLTDLDLNISKAYIASDGGWFMDVFHVTDQQGNKIQEGDVLDNIEKALVTRKNKVSAEFPGCAGKFVGAKSIAEHTIIELTGTDRPGLLSEVSAVLTSMDCRVHAAEVWTHNRRCACMIYITDEDTSGPLCNVRKLAGIKERLRLVMKGDNDERRVARTNVAAEGVTHPERRLHQLMFADKDYEASEKFERSKSMGGKVDKPTITVQSSCERGYSIINVQCKDRPKLLFDTVCTLTDMQYDVFHATATVDPFGPFALQEFHIRQMDGQTLSPGAEEQVKKCLEAAIERRSSKGLRLELCTGDRVGLLSDMTRIFSENGLSVTRADVSTQGDKAINVFYVTDPSGDPVDKTVERIRRNYPILGVKEMSSISGSPQVKEQASSPLSSFLKSSERFFQGLTTGWKMSTVA